MYIFVSTEKFPVSTGKFPVSTLVGVFAGTLWCVLHRKNLDLRRHPRVHSRVHFREHFRERVRGSNFAVRVLCAFSNICGLKGCLAVLPGNRPKSALSALFLPFPEA